MTALLAFGVSYPRSELHPGPGHWIGQTLAPDAGPKAAILMLAAVLALWIWWRVRRSGERI